MSNEDRDVLELLGEGPMPSLALAVFLGREHHLTLASLQRLRDAGVVESIRIDCLLSSLTHGERRLAGLIEKFNGVLIFWRPAGSTPNQGHEPA